MQALWDRFRSMNRLFLLTVILPTILAGLYFGLLSSDVYISESRFLVRSPDKPAATSFGILLKGAGISNAGDEVFAAQSFVMSRDALRELDRNQAYRKAYTGNSISVFDRFNPFGWSGSFEELYHYYEGRVNVDHDTTSSITTLSVRAYSPATAQQVNRRLLEMAEATVNRLNDRARADLIRVASSEVDAAESRSRAAALALSGFRNRAGVVDPEKQATVQLQMVSKLQDELIATRAQLAQMRKIAPDNPQIEVLEAQVRSLSGDIDAQTGKVAGNRNSLSSSAAQYQRLQLESQFADRQLGSAMSSLQEAENEALRKQAYIERIVQPNLPDHATEPRRLRSIFATFLLGIVAFGILSMLIAGVREHQD